MKERQSRIFRRGNKVVENPFKVKITPNPRTRYSDMIFTGIMKMKIGETKTWRDGISTNDMLTTKDILDEFNESRFSKYHKFKMEYDLTGITKVCLT